MTNKQLLNLVKKLREKRNIWKKYALRSIKSSDTWQDAESKNRMKFQMAIEKIQKLIDQFNNKGY